MAPTPPRPLRVLVAEDNPINQQLARLLLERAGYRADIVGNGLEVLDALDRRPYDVVLMDVLMPEMDGLEATRRIRARGLRTYVVAVTANAVKGDREECLAAGVDDFVAKPIRLAELIRALSGCSAALADEDAEEGEDAPGETLDPAILDPAILDPSRLSRLSDELGDHGPALVERLLATFFEQAPALLAAARRAVDAGDAPEARRNAHNLKSNAASLGAGRLSSVCREVEARAAAGDLDAAGALLGDVETELALATDALRAVQRRQSSPASGDGQ